MDVPTFIDKFADCFQRFMTEAQLSSAVAMVIDESVVSEVAIKLPVLKSGLTLLIDELQSLHDHYDSSNAERQVTDAQCQNCKQREEDENSKPILTLDPTIIQITADNREIDRRIRAFIEKKQTEKDDTNRREFCTLKPLSSESCARTDAVFTSKIGGRSHVKVSKVVNKYGPQTRPALVSVPAFRSVAKRSRSPPDSSRRPTDVADGVEERLHNMESYLKIKSGQQSSSSDIFQRLKLLEDRILHLESISPEYSNISSSMSKHQRLDPVGKAAGRDTSVQDIDNRIKELQHSLRIKKAHMEARPDKADT